MATAYPQTRLYASLRWEASQALPFVNGDIIAFQAPRERLILLVHGYNVSLSTGHRLLRLFEDRLRDKSASLARDVGWLMWPGDLPLPVLSMVSYPFKLGATLELGRRIASFLASLTSAQGAPPEIVLVAHSLGCKVVLETVEQLRASFPAVQVRVFLMAAAVAVEDVLPGGRLHGAARHAHERAVLHSTSDWVLRVGFRIGQFAAPNAAYLRGAVGSEGRPEEAWTHSRPMTGLGHSAYWKHVRSVDEFVAWMGKAAVRGSPARALPTEPPPPGRSLPRRALPSRD